MATSHTITAVAVPPEATSRLPSALKRSDAWPASAPSSERRFLAVGSIAEHDALARRGQQFSIGTEDGTFRWDSEDDLLGGNVNDACLLVGADDGQSAGRRD